MVVKCATEAFKFFENSERVGEEIKLVERIKEKERERGIRKETIKRMFSQKRRNKLESSAVSASFAAASSSNSTICSLATKKSSLLWPKDSITRFFKPADE